MITLIDNPKDIARELARKYDVRMSVESLYKLSEIIEPRKIRHRTLMLETGETSSSIFYIAKGLIRLYKPDSELDIVEEIIHEGDMLICAESLFKHEPSTLNIQTLEPTIAYEIKYDDLRELASSSSEICNLLHAILEESILLKEKRHHLFDKNPADRYTTLLQTDSEIVRRTPLKYIASYLRMAPETLSRVRNTLNKRENSNS